MEIRSLSARLGDLSQQSLTYYRDNRVASCSYPALQQDVYRVADNLRQCGVGRGIRVGILAPNMYEWLVHDLALIDLGAVIVALPVEYFRDTSYGELAANYGLSLLLVAKEHLGDDTPPWVRSLDDRGDRETALRDAGDAVPLGDDIFTLVFSSGTSGRLKCLKISERGTNALIASFGRDFEFRPDDAILAFLPLSSFQQRWMLYTAIWYGFNLLLTDTPRLFRSLRDMQPTILAAPPLLYESVETRYYNLSRHKLAVMAAAQRLISWIPSERGRKRAAQLVFRQVYRAFGGRIRFMLTGAAPSRISTLKLFEALNLPLYQGYGLTETGFLSWNLPGQNRPGSVGKPVFPGSLTIADDGEIIFQNERILSRGYLNGDSEEQAKTFIAPDQIATGDIGRFDEDGYLYIEGRKKEIIITQGGFKLQPEELEARIEHHVQVARAVVLGGGELPSLVALISLRVPESAKLKDSIQDTIDAINRTLPEGARVQRVVYTSTQLNLENGLLNRSMKVNRKGVLTMFRSELLA